MTAGPNTSPPAAQTDMEMSPGVNALVLSGGGANGAYEVGVAKALFGAASPSTGRMGSVNEKDYKPLYVSVISGTSIGAFNAGVLTSKIWEGGLVAAQRLEDIWLNVIPRDDSTNHNYVFRFRGNPSEFLNASLIYRNPLLPWKDFFGDGVFFFQNFMASLGVLFGPGNKNLEARISTSLDFSALIDNGPSLRLVQKCVDYNAIQQSPVKLRIISTNWDAGVTKTFENADMTQGYYDRIVLSSTAIPGLFPPVTIDGVSYVDGGVLTNTPLLPAIRAGADTIHVVYLDPDVAAMSRSVLNSTLDAMTRMFAVQFASRMNEDIKRVAMVNRAITQLESMGKLNQDPAKFTQMFGISSLRRLVIHRYHPREDLGGGLLGWLNFNQQRNQNLIDRGFRDAVEHDCHRSQCIQIDGATFPSTVGDA